MVNNLIVCGGTFDHFHQGHKEFLKYAFSLGKNIIIGITGDSYILHSKSKIKNPRFIESFRKRKQSVSEFIKLQKISDKVKLVKIDDSLGPTLSKDLLIDAIVVSKDTKKGAEIINQERANLDLPPLKIFIAPSVGASDGKPISSERIRKGEIDRQGKLYVKPLWLKRDLTLPEDLRQELKKPFGFLDCDFLKPQDQSDLVISVGDVTTKILNELSFKQKLSVIDFKIARKETLSSFSDLGFSGGEKVVFVKNPAGYIARDLFLKVSEIIKSDFNKRTVLNVIGEEDLAVLPLILVAPLGTIIYYGQPNVGTVKISVSENSKEQAYNLVSKFRPT
jgi:pantetheine-phosphate adenylyltransferase